MVVLGFSKSETAGWGAPITLAILGVFLFPTYFMQQNLAVSPIQTGFAFLPMVVSTVIASLSAQTRILPRSGPRPLVVSGMILAALGTITLIELDFSSTYLLNVFPGLLLAGLGFGSIFATAINTASFLVGEATTPTLAAEAEIHGCTVAF